MESQYCRTTAERYFLAVLRRFESYDLLSSEPAKVLLIDIVLSDIIPLYPKLKVWKGEPLGDGTVGGIADYLIAPRRAYVKTPLLCAIVAKRDDFKTGEIQCIAEMAACRDNNSRDGHDMEIHGIVGYSTSCPGRPKFSSPVCLQ